MSQRSTEPHKLGRPGATPGSAIVMVEYANWKSGLVERQGFCRFESCLDYFVFGDRVVQRLRHLHDTQEIEGSIPSAIIDGEWFVSVPASKEFPTGR